MELTDKEFQDYVRGSPGLRDIVAEREEARLAVSHAVRHFWQLHTTSCSLADNKAACQRAADEYEDALWARYGRRLRLAA